VGIQTSKTHSASKISPATLFDRLFRVFIEVLLSKTKINYEDLFEVLAEDEVGGLHVSVDVVAFMYLLNGLEHLNQQLDRNSEVEVVLEDASNLG
jgi:hypothetical protein